MQGLARIATWMAVGAVVAGSQLLSPTAEAARFSNHHRPSQLIVAVSMRAEAVGVGAFGHRGTKHAFAKGTKVRYGSYGVLQCVRLGHVAVVTAIDDPRHIEIEHANWGGPGAISRNIPVEDVSANNDWTAVRVGLGHTGEYGGVYPTYGFIYDRPDGGMRVAAQPYAEVAQAPDNPVRVNGRVAGVLDLSPIHGR